MMIVIFWFEFLWLSVSAQLRVVTIDTVNIGSGNGLMLNRQAGNWTNDGIAKRCHMVSLGHNWLTVVICSWVVKGGFKTYNQRAFKCNQIYKANGHCKLWSCLAISFSCLSVIFSLHKLPTDHAILTSWISYERTCMNMINTCYN